MVDWLMGWTEAKLTRAELTMISGGYRLIGAGGMSLDYLRTII